MNMNATFETTDVMGWRLRLLQFIAHSPKLNCIVLLLLGASGTLSFAPFYLWPCYLVGIAYLLVSLLVSLHTRQAFIYGLSFALGLFGTGVSWVYVSIATFGQVGIEVAILITFGFVLAAALYWAIFGATFHKLRLKLPSKYSVPAFLLGLLGFEWLRSTLFTGFPWLLPGYIVEHTWLFELLPIGGIWLVSLLCLISAAGLSQSIVFKQYRWLIASAAIWLVAAGVSLYQPTFVNHQTAQTVTLVQGNIPQDEKWVPEHAANALGYYQQATTDHLDSDIIIWPETAITYPLYQIQPYFSEFSRELAQQDTTLITGVPVYEKDKNQFFNGVWATGNGFGLYEKQKLVPFGEYIPLSDFFGPILDLFGMPMSDFRKGPENQPTLQAGELSIAPFICYEVVYSDLVRSMVRDSDILLTISNDGWFGDSIGPLQHLQIAQFRAKEAGRYMIRATNNGVTAIIDEHGTVTERMPQFVQGTLTGKVYPMTGNTPYVVYGNLILWLVLALIVSVASLPIRNRNA